MAQHFYLAPPAGIPAAYHVFLGARTADGAGAIYRALISAGGVLTQPQPEACAVFEEPGAPWCAVSPRGDHLYVPVRQGSEPEHNYVAGFGVDPSSGALAVLNRQTTVLPGSPHCVVDPTARMVICSHMSGAGVSVLPLDADGALQPATATKLEGGGSGVNRGGGQDQPFAHSVQMAMGGRHVLVPDRGADKVWCFCVDPGTPSLSPAACPAWAAAPGSGPRHLAAHPNGRWLYVICELSCTMVALEFDSDSGQMVELCTLPTLPADWEGSFSPASGDSLGCTTADVHVSADGMVGHLLVGEFRPW